MIYTIKTESKTNKKRLKKVIIFPMSISMILLLKIIFKYMLLTIILVETCKLSQT